MFKDVVKEMKVADGTYFESEDYWDQLRNRVNDIHARLSKKPARFQKGFICAAGGVLNAYREGDISFEQAVTMIESGELTRKKE